MRRLFFGSLAVAAAMACMVMFAAPQIVTSGPDQHVTQLATLGSADHAYLAEVAVYRFERVAPATAVEYTAMSSQRIRPSRLVVRFGALGLNPKPAHRYLC